jgi:prephenate dehydratase
MKVGVLGPEGTFSEKACREHFPHAQLCYYDDFDEILASVEKGDVDAGVVPLENSLEGSVGQTLDGLLRREVKIVGEVNVRVRHCLVGRSRPEEVKVILSHPQALAQCRRYLKKHYPGVEVRTTGSTTHAARLAQEFPEMAAIAGADAAARYGLKVMTRDIQDSEENVTRFAVVGRDVPPATGQDKTSLAIYLERTSPGALWDVLGEFAIRGINLTKIESRPSRKELGDYYFFIDLEGHVSDPPVSEALCSIEKKAAMTKLLGSYPRTRSF